MIDINAITNVHFIGIGGVSNSAIAEILNHNGYHVSGSDLNTSTLTKRLADKGIVIYRGHAEENVQGAELVVYTAAVSDDNPELQYAMTNNIPCLSRAEMLGQLMLGYEKTIAISGTHGKTTTTSMLTRIFNDPTYDPTSLIGGDFADIGSNVRIGKGEIFITEACEYKESFLSFYPSIGIVLNVDEDHLDYYRDLDHIASAFVKFAGNIREDGLLVINGDDFNARKVRAAYTGKCLTYGITLACDFTAKNIIYNNYGYPTFDIYNGDTFITKISLSIPGQHNIYNALAAFTAATQLTSDIEAIVTRLASFRNANRRFEHIGEAEGVLLVDDYAHHPMEIKATLDAAARMASVKRIRVAFQPHTYSRTKELLHAFSGAFTNADEVIVTDIYAAREKDPGDIHARDLVKALQAEGVNALYLETFEAIEAHFLKTAVAGDLIMSVGAGDIYKVTHTLAHQWGAS
ncbi:UDP-N-acetylmuramate--L-alanine ligase [Fusibacter paucivorans]|uniref:UDP-N-acetylmuramate--L-alanine ligase n=1 Tax=Fusibacter paucivorans TaxID=76009 RepID=A0ABS5PQ10_9FIRM|nr:UDP-N-acetylmuramate--L-alanine ligase [Fusibacter paucivorans]MBS7527260.1 UDP-N-acetylmuramate--L-alanine ligase [Fusibacter paucivorans]